LLVLAISPRVKECMIPKRAVALPTY